jgi:hypothetical protein
MLLYWSRAANRTWSVVSRQLSVDRRASRLAVKDGSPSTARDAPVGDAGDEVTMQLYWLRAANRTWSVLRCPLSVVSGQLIAAPAVAP